MRESEKMQELQDKDKWSEKHLLDSWLLAFLSSVLF